MRKKINSYSKESVLKIVILVLMITVFVILMTQPERFGYPYSMVEVDAKKESFESLNTQILSEQQMLESKQSELKMVEDELNIKQQNSDDIAKKLDMENLDLHIPSLLLVLEEQAVENDLAIHIKYDEKSIVSSSYYDPYDPVVEVDFGTEEIQDDFIDIEYESIETQNNQIDIPPIDGLNILVLPVDIEGNYVSLRNFIKYLDTMDFIIPYSVNVETQGDYVIGELVVQIFYEGGY